MKHYPINHFLQQKDAEKLAAEKADEAERAHDMSNILKAGWRSPVSSAIFGHSYKRTTRHQPLPALPRPRQLRSTVRTIYSLFTLRKPRPALRINGERGFLRVDRLYPPPILRIYYLYSTISQQRADTFVLMSAQTCPKWQFLKDYETNPQKTVDTHYRWSLVEVRMSVQS